MGDFRSFFHIQNLVYFAQDQRKFYALSSTISVRRNDRFIGIIL